MYIRTRISQDPMSTRNPCSRYVRPTRVHVRIRELLLMLIVPFVSLSHFHFLTIESAVVNCSPFLSLSSPSAFSSSSSLFHLAHRYTTTAALAGKYPKHVLLGLYRIEFLGFHFHFCYHAGWTRDQDVVVWGPMRCPIFETRFLVKLNWKFIPSFKKWPSWFLYIDLHLVQLCLNYDLGRWL